MTQCSKILLEKLTVVHLVNKDSIQSSHLTTALYPVPHESNPHRPLQPYPTFVLCGIFRRKAYFINPHCTVLLYYRVPIQLHLTNISISITISKKSSFHLSSDRTIFLRMVLKPVLKPVKVYGRDSKVLVSDYVSEHRRSSRTVLCMAEE
jgi:hypothetical protein